MQTYFKLQIMTDLKITMNSRGMGGGGVLTQSHVPWGCQLIVKMNFPLVVLVPCEPSSSLVDVVYDFKVSQKSITTMDVNVWTLLIFSWLAAHYLFPPGSSEKLVIYEFVCSVFIACWHFTTTGLDRQISCLMVNTIHQPSLCSNVILYWVKFHVLVGTSRPTRLRFIELNW